LYCIFAGLIDPSVLRQELPLFRGYHLVHPGHDKHSSSMLFSDDTCISRQANILGALLTHLRMRYRKIYIVVHVVVMKYVGSMSDRTRTA
jgi:hypothetical protein